MVSCSMSKKEALLFTLPWCPARSRREKPIPPCSFVTPERTPDQPVRRIFPKSFLHSICWPRTNSNLRTQRPVRAPLLAASFRRDSVAPVVERGGGGGTGREPRVGAHRDVPSACHGTRKRTTGRRDNPPRGGGREPIKLYETYRDKRWTPPPIMTTARTAMSSMSPASSCARAPAEVRSGPAPARPVPGRRRR